MRLSGCTGRELGFIPGPQKRPLAGRLPAWKAMFLVYAACLTKAPFCGVPLFCPQLCRQGGASRQRFVRTGAGPENADCVSSGSVFRMAGCTACFRSGSGRVLPAPVGQIRLLTVSWAQPSDSASSIRSASRKVISCSRAMRATSSYSYLPRDVPKPEAFFFRI